MEAEGQSVINAVDSVISHVTALSKTKDPSVTAVIKGDTWQETVLKEIERPQWSATNATRLDILPGTARVTVF